MFSAQLEFLDGHERHTFGKFAPSFVFRETFYDPGALVLRFHLLPLHLPNTGNFRRIKRTDKALDLVVAVPLIFRFKLSLRSALLIAAPFLFFARFALGVRLEAVWDRGILLDEMDIEAGRVRILAGI